MAGGSLRALRSRPFALVWSGALVSNVGTWMETIALGRYVADITGRAAWVGLVAAAGFLPTAVFGLLGGALADRWSRARLLIVSNLVQALVAGGVTWLVATNRATPSLLALAALATGTAGAVGFPSFQAALPDLVPTEDVPAAVGLSSVQWNLGRIVGPTLAGLMGIRAALTCNTLSFLAVVVAVAMARIPRPVAKATVHPPLRESIAEGWRTVRRVPGLRAMNAVMCLTTFVAAPFIALIPAMVNQALHAGRGANSTLVVAQGIGAVVAGLFVGGLVGLWGLRRTMVVAVSGLPVALALYGLAPALGTMALALVLVGGCYMLALSSFSTIAQRLAPAAQRGRVLSINNGVLGLLYPLGAVSQGWLGDHVGVRRVTVGSGIALAAVLVGVRLLRPGFTAAISESVTVAGPAGSAVAGRSA